MKKILLGILVFMCFINVNAKDYELKELIPTDEKVSVTTQSFFYHDFSYNKKNNDIEFDSVKNLSNKEKNISITVGFFDENKRNIGLYNYCNKNYVLNQNDEKSINIDITNDLLFDSKKIEDINYISIMSENPNCNSGTNFDYVGKKIEFIEFEDKADYDYTYIKYCLSLLVLILIVLVAKFIFDVTINKNSRITDRLFGITKDKRTNEEIRDEYFKRREEEKLKNKKVEEKREIKDISQEDGKTDLHNMYK